MNLLEIAHKHGIELEGACEASLACSTCHIIFVDADEFEKSGEISDEENDMLDLAFGLSQTYVPLTPRNNDSEHFFLPSVYRIQVSTGMSSYSFKRARWHDCTTP